MRTHRSTDRVDDPGTTLPPSNDTMWQRMVTGQWYLASDPEIAAANARAMRLAAEFNACWATDSSRGHDIVGQLLGTIGQGSTVRGPIQVDYGCNLHIGQRVFINFGLIALDVAPIHIGDEAQLGPGVQLLTAVHPIAPGARRAGIEAADPIVIGEGAWIGGGAVILGGVDIGANAVVGAGAVVTRDVPADTVVAGNPARIIHDRRMRRV
ncbi:sugar O-acetyltransferase [Corynebacterium sp. TAE3-ERU12]|uniref:sugar O-acetyltransferase n=1 Tax=Corynebacterium sp. TAE3-ERU12 TaxID=2849491 RepID=UPI001C46B904|nr:sugar O-acetyltransferase [Corynebacterium sp. TAE3-ERU12]MBV7296211.1 sugar O-acetyltransferase [Corynebacterium sp. TAE3-ERU12]